MQNYGQPPVYQRPGSTTSFAGQQAPPPIPPAYGGYQSTGPQNQSQWAAPAQNQTPNPQWNQPQQQTEGGYYTGIYGNQAPQTYPPPQHDQPPPPPPKPYGFAGAVQQQQLQGQQQQQQQYNHSWPQQQHQNIGITPQQQEGEHNRFPVQGALQQPYNHVAPPPPSATPGGSYFPPPQTPQNGRPSSIYTASKGPSYSNSSTIAPHQHALPVTSPNEQQPAYVPPSLTGQGVQAYMPSNTNPMPGVYVPPPPDVPAWQQAQHAPLQGGTKRFKYTKPSTGSNSQVQSQLQHPPQVPPRPHEHFERQQLSGHPPNAHQYVSHGQMPLQPPPAQNQYISQPQPQSHTVQYPQAQQLPYGQSMPPPPPTQFQEQSVFQPSHDAQLPGGQSQLPLQYPQQQGASNMSMPFAGRPEQHHWPTPAPVDQRFYPQQQIIQQPHGDQQQPAQLQPGHSLPQSSSGPSPNPPIQPTSDIAPHTFSQPSPQSQPVSPIAQRQSVGFVSGYQPIPGQTGSVSSIALANLHAQREGSKTGSPKPLPPNIPTPPPPRDDKSRFSVLSSGGPSDWEHFGAVDVDDEDIFAKKPQPAQLDSVELPAHVPEQDAGPSPPSTHGWPSPAIHPTASAGPEGADTYQPTPPPENATIVDRSSSQPGPATSQQSFAVDDGAWSRSAQHSQPQPLPPSQDFVVDDGGWVAHSVRTREHTPVQQQRQLPHVETSDFVVKGVAGAAEQTPTQSTSAWEARSTESHVAELKEKDAAFRRMQEALELEKDSLQKEIEKIKADIGTASIQAADEMTELNNKIEGLKVAEQQAKTNAATASKERDLTIERLKEDVEGKDHNIQERDNIIADLRRQLETEKTRERPRSTPMPADLVPDLDVWYAGSLERYIGMLRREASESRVEDKIKTFKNFLRAESTIRGIEYDNALPPASVNEPGLCDPTFDESKGIEAPHSIVTGQSSPIVPDREAGTSSNNQSTHTREGLKVIVPHESPSPPEEDYDYSPGGRPILRQKGTLPPHDNLSSQPVPPSVRSSTIMTPTSSVEDDLNKTPVQSKSEFSQTQYKAYVPPVTTTSPTPTTHRQTLSNSNVPTVGTLHSSDKTHDEIFFGASAKPTARSPSSDSSTSEIAVPAPLSLASHRPVSTGPPPRSRDISATLKNLLPTQIARFGTNRYINEVKTKLQPFNQDTHSIDELTRTWEQSASSIRKKNDAARRQRQEENEESNDDAFNNEELSYADLNVLEEEFKQKEGELKAREDRDEYKSYVETVFDPVYDSLQNAIQELLGVYRELEASLHTSVSGVRSLGNSETPSTSECLKLLQDVHDDVLDRQEKVMVAVAERDKRYKKTEIQPLYVSGNIAKMKTVEKHFENAEKEAVVRAKRDRATRVGELVSVAEDVVVSAVGVEQREIDAIIAAIRELEDGAGDAALLARAHDTLKHLKSSSKTLLGLLNALEIELNESVMDAEIAQERADNADAVHVQELETEKSAEEKKMRDEYARRIQVLEQDNEEIEALIASKSELAGESEEQQRQKRLKAALKEAKRRNGDA